MEGLSVERAPEAIRTAADGGGPALASTPYIADDLVDLVEDMVPRRAVLKAFFDKG